MTPKEQITLAREVTDGRELDHADAQELAAAFVALTERLATVSDENYGPFPVQTADEHLTSIEAGAFEQRKRIFELERQVERGSKAIVALAIANTELGECTVNTILLEHSRETFRQMLAELKEGPAVKDRPARIVALEAVLDLISPLRTDSGPERGRFTPAGSTEDEVRQGPVCGRNGSEVALSAPSSDGANAPGPTCPGDETCDGKNCRYARLHSASPAFAAAWHEMREHGFQYGPDALENVHLGWMLATDGPRALWTKAGC
jgi:hypothetical protein